MLSIFSFIYIRFLIFIVYFFRINCYEKYCWVLGREVGSGLEG